VVTGPLPSRRRSARAAAAPAASDATALARTNWVAVIQASQGTVHVRWDRGGDLGLIPDHDQWEIIPERPAPVISPGAEPDRVMTLRCLASRLLGAEQYADGCSRRAG
jgi:hypothetical protein